MTFESELESAINKEMARINENLLSGTADVRAYDRFVGGYHALRLILEEHIPEIRKKLNER